MGLSRIQFLAGGATPTAWNEFLPFLPIALIGNLIGIGLLFFVLTARRKKPTTQQLLASNLSGAIIIVFLFVDLDWEAITEWRIHQTLLEGVLACFIAISISSFGVHLIGKFVYVISRSK